MFYKDLLRKFPQGPTQCAFRISKIFVASFKHTKKVI